MLTDKDIQKLKAELATKKDLGELRKDFQASDAKLLDEIFTTRKGLEDFREEMKKSFSDLQTAVDAYAQKVDAFAQEMIMLAHKVDRHEKWLQQIAEKIGIKLEY